MNRMKTKRDEPDKPLISILMAVYEPRMDWLREQLKSLEAQSYPHLALYVRDDCSPSVPYDDICRCVGECIHSFPYEIKRNEKNLGSNLTFERLTKEAEGEYFAYCDQDDVWLPEKLEVLYNAIESEGAQLVCSDMFIIDENGRQVADSITKARKHHVFRSGEGLAPKLLISNFVTGCAMLIRADTARQAVPFCPYMVHDHYLGLYSAREGKVVSLRDNLIRYRIHSGNQTLMMSGVVDKESYYNERIVKLLYRLEWLERAFRDSEALHQEIVKAVVWAKARKANFNREKGTRKDLLKYWRFSPWTSLFEAVAAAWPERLFMFFIEIKRNNIV